MEELRYLKHLDVELKKHGMFFGKDYLRSNLYGSGNRQLISADKMDVGDYENLEKGVDKEQWIRHFKEVLEEDCNDYAIILKAIVSFIKESNSKESEVFLSYIQIYLYKDNQTATLTSDKMARILYLYLYLAIVRRLPDDSYFGEYIHYEADLREFMDEVVVRHGVSGRTGYDAIVRLSNRKNEEDNNIFAIYELGEMYYSGRIGGEVDYEKAYHEYQRLAEPELKHPLAAWSLGYMHYWYQKKERELANAKIEEIDLRFPRTEDRMRRGLEYLRMAATADIGNKGNIYNLIGLMLNDPESRNWGVKGIGLISMDPEWYFERAVEEGYPFAYNNLVKLYLRQVQEPGCTNSKKQIVEKIRSYREEAVKLNEPWAINQLGCHLSEGLAVTCGEEQIFVYHKNIERAVSLFEKAAEAEIASVRLWARYNIVKYGCLNEEYSKNVLRQSVKVERCIDELRAIQEETDNKDLVKKCEILIDAFCQQVS